MAQKIHAPRHLSARSRRVYRQVVEDYDLSGEAHALEVLRLALEALDRADQAREALARYGSTTYTNRFGEPRPRPEVAIERDARLAVWRGFRELSLDGGDYAPGHMPRVGGARS